MWAWPNFVPKCHHCKFQTSIDALKSYLHPGLSHCEHNQDENNTHLLTLIVIQLDTIVRKTLPLTCHVLIMPVRNYKVLKYNEVPYKLQIITQKYHYLGENSFLFLSSYDHLLFDVTSSPIKPHSSPELFKYVENSLIISEG